MRVPSSRQPTRDLAPQPSGYPDNAVEAYRTGSRASVTFVDLPPFGEDGHFTFARGDPAIWAAPVDRYLASLQIAGSAPKSYGE
jgi:hypothetical protein